ncbi:hypothetical protein CSV67_08985 [Sporosarcina sp. P2]|nr:hypothetical protein SporoP8_11945 [Sporosarcina ureae]PIC68148.1 hypothetical protein CSV78_03860 [Sporosarcina sp. P16a]PIC71046.1 hypothetical protein CSV77_03120 [Sporosarcina sp. P16b]PIC82421.1 hypothetical protein CSV73_12810 [Sporosarcina sp. P1]PIC91021.1 hypothetical protein CSV71_01980 [Sporosarcina sp. P21c]PIC94485.1 hypothetical protein CSV70_00500 [Sporosarcina sp. P25]PID02427.1 hypothetical protein CSV67_08985 [Sporosarcina sp. P2]PID15148.1 hypothetical protein CSV63_082
METMDSMLGSNPLLAIVSHIFFIGISFVALQAILPENIIRKNRVFQTQLLFILLSIAIGSTVSKFFLDISYWSGRWATWF